MIKKHFIFDLDGTLTDSNTIIDEEFKSFFYNFCLNNNVYIVTGANRNKTLFQLTEPIYNECKLVFQCSANEVYKKDKLLYSNTFNFNKEIEDFLLNELKNSAFNIKTGDHFDIRNGSINFSILGRNATLNEREQYIKFDLLNSERLKIIKKFNKKFNNITAKLGGETGIDIAEKGKDKSQVLKYFNCDDFLIFFGDKTDKLGNDYPLIINNKGLNFNVKNWKHTFEILKSLI